MSASPSPAPRPAVPQSPQPQAAAWQDAVVTGLDLCTQFVVSGNVRDVFPTATPGGTLFLPFEDALWALLKAQGLAGLLVHDPVDGLRLHPGAEPAVGPAIEAAGLALDTGAEAGPGIREVARRVATLRDVRVALMLDYASHLPERDAGTFERLLIGIDKLARGPLSGGGPPFVIRPHRNPIFWILDEPGDLPDWFAVGKPSVREIAVELPSLDMRVALAEALVGQLPDAPGPEARRRSVETLALLSEGSTLLDMGAIAGLARAQGFGTDRWDEAIRAWRTGIRRNPWKSPVLRERLRRGREILGARVKGQDRAIERTLSILVRSVVGLSGSQASSRLNRPRGVLFFAGPTGVGKTELAKALTELLFGDDTMCLRFDMTEFSDERSVTRLVGAPPGYPGHELGGELTNAVRNRPFSVILFDEVEKAHPRVLDMFLQILDEGRLTDSRGATAFFSEAVIVFTSNIGIFGKDRATNMGMEVLPSDTFDTVESKLLEGVRNHFCYELRRPELMNRIGQNVVVFDFVHMRTAALIFSAVVERVLEAVRREQGTEVTFTQDAFLRLQDLCLGSFTDGGRGIGNRVEVNLINPLAQALFDLGAPETLVIAGVERTEGGTRLRFA